MTIKIIGAGLGRTRTMSLKAALEELGFGKCYHMKELLETPEQITHWEAAGRGKAVAWDELFAGYRATVDYPACRYWRELMRHYPDTKILLSIRDPDSWCESANNTIYRVEPGLIERLKVLAKLLFSPRLRYMVRIFGMIRRVIYGKAISRAALRTNNSHWSDFKSISRRSNARCRRSGCWCLISKKVGSRCAGFSRFLFPKSLFRGSTIATIFCKNEMSF